MPTRTIVASYDGVRDIQIPGLDLGPKVKLMFCDTMKKKDMAFEEAQLYSYQQTETLLETQEIPETSSKISLERLKEHEKNMVWALWAVGGSWYMVALLKVFDGMYL